MGANAATWYYSYDNNNQMTSAVEDSKPTGGTVLATATYLYDAQQNRIEQDEWTQSSGLLTVTRFAADGNQVWADLKMILETPSTGWQVSRQTIGGGCGRPGVGYEDCPTVTESIEKFAPEHPDFFHVPYAI
jgi:hypothetical protein